LRVWRPEREAGRKAAGNEGGMRGGPDPAVEIAAGFATLMSAPNTACTGALLYVENTNTNAILSLAPS